MFFRFFFFPSGGGGGSHFTNPNCNLTGACRSSIFATSTVAVARIKYLLPTLSRNGRADVALIVAQQRTPPSYVYMVEQGATTLWETWTSTRYAPGMSNHTMGVPSWNHIM